MNIRFDHIMIRTTDIERSRLFYENIFDMEVINRDHYPDFDLCYMLNKETNIKFELRHDKYFDRVYYNSASVVGHFAFYVDDVSEIERRLHNYFPELNYDIKKHVSEVHGKEYLILTVISPEGCEMSALQKTKG